MQHLNNPHKHKAYPKGIITSINSKTRKQLHWLISTYFSDFSSAIIILQTDNMTCREISD
jgi:hypothetical protein